MAYEKLTSEQLEETARAFEAAGRNYAEAGRILGLARATVQHRVAQAGKYGLLGPAAAIPGFAISQVTTKAADGSIITQRPVPEPHEAPDGMTLNGVSKYVPGDGWYKYGRDKSESSLAEFAAGLAGEIGRSEVVSPSGQPLNADLLNCFVITDYHLGMLADADETGAADWDLKIAEDLLVRWFEVAIAKSPDAEIAVLAQGGDLTHYDSMESVTPASGHVLDADSRPQKMIRVAVRVMRKVAQLLLAKHKHVHFISADANHDPMGSAWQREFWSMHYENEPRITVETSPDTYYAYEFGQTSLFFHHGHKRNLANIDHVFAGKFRELFGRTKFSYAHVGHLHQQAVRESNLMVIEQHATLAPEDAYASRGGWSHQRNAKVITYHKRYGEVSRSTISSRMVYGGG